MRQNSAASVHETQTTGWSGERGPAIPAGAMPRGKPNASRIDRPSIRGSSRRNFRARSTTVSPSIMAAQAACVASVSASQNGRESVTVTASSDTGVLPFSERGLPIRNVPAGTGSIRRRTPSASSSVRGGSDGASTGAARPAGADRRFT